jgi:hypothetical protein
VNLFLGDSIMRTNPCWIAALVLTAWLRPAIGQEESPRLTVPEIIEKVTANERLYENIDVSVLFRHQDPTAEQLTPVEQPGSTLFFTSTQQSEIRYVGQNGRFRVDRKGVAQSGHKKFSLDRRWAFDGKVTRLLDGGNLGNIVQGRKEDENVMRPHMLLLRFMPFQVPLSTYLSGHEAMKAHPGGHWEANHFLQVSYRGEEEYKGLRCHRVWITTSIPEKKPYDRWDLLLAEDRNFIPVHNVGYTFQFSERVPLLEASVTEWTEIEEGIWFPKATEVQSYDRWTVKAEGVKKPTWRHELDVKEVSLDPQFDLTYFQDVPFPDGTVAYDVDAAGEITDSK